MGGHVEHLVAGEAAAMAQSLREVRLADAALADEEYVLLARDVSARGQVNDLGLGHLGVEEKVEVLEGLVRFERGAAQTLLELLALAPLDLVVEHAQ